MAAKDTIFINISNEVIILPHHPSHCSSSSKSSSSSSSSSSSWSAASASASASDKRWRGHSHCQATGWTLYVALITRYVCKFMKYDVCAIVNRTYYCIFEMLFTLMLNILDGHEDIVTYCRPGNWYISKYVNSWATDVACMYCCYRSIIYWLIEYPFI